MTRGLLLGVFVTPATKLEGRTGSLMPDSTSVRAPAHGYASGQGARSARPQPRTGARRPRSGDRRRHRPHPRLRGPRGEPTVAAARAAQARGRAPRPEARGSLLKAGARALREHARELAALQTLEVGMPLRESLGGVEAGIAAFEAYAELGPVDRGRAATRRPRAARAARRGRDPDALVRPAGGELRRTRGRARVRQRGRAQAVREGAAGGGADGRAARSRRRSCNCCTATSAPPARWPRTPRWTSSSALGRRPRAATWRSSTRASTRPGRRARSRPARSPAPASPAGRSSASSCTSASPRPSSTRSPRRARALRSARDGPGHRARPVIDADHRMWVHRQVQDAVYGGAELLAGGAPLPRAGFFYPPTSSPAPPTTRSCTAVRRAARSHRPRQPSLRGRTDRRTGRDRERPHPRPRARPPRLDELNARTVSINAVFRAAPRRRAGAARRGDADQSRPRQLTPPTLGKDQGHLG